MSKNWEYYDEERIGEFAVESFDFDDEYDSLEPSEYDELRVLDEIDELVELAELAEESALAELAAFGFVTPGYERKFSEYDSDEIVCLFEYGVEWDEFGCVWGEDALVFDEYTPYSLMV